MEENYKGRNTMSTLQQIRKIHTLKSLLCMSDEVYRKLLHSFDSVSSKTLTEAEADILISILDAKVRILNLKKYDGFIGRDGDMATPLQLRKMEVVWKSICKNKAKKHRYKSLRRYLSLHFHINDIRFLTKERAGKIIGIMEKKILKAV